VAPDDGRGDCCDNSPAGEARTVAVAVGPGAGALGVSVKGGPVIVLTVTLLSRGEAIDCALTLITWFPTGALIAGLLTGPGARVNFGGADGCLTGLADADVNRIPFGRGNEGGVCIPAAALVLI